MAINCDPSSLANAARCFFCWPDSTLREIRTYLLCQLNLVGGFGLNLIPSNAKYGGGATPEFDLTVLANTSYTIVWGSNDLSMTLCGVNYPSTGVGTITAVFTGACTTMQFFGAFAGTTVTARVHVNRGIIPIATGLTLQASADGTQSVATWDNPNFLLVTYAELWTSTDNVTFALAATVNFPTATASVAAPVITGTLYAKVRWCGPTSPCGAFSASVSLNGRVTDWVRRVVVNGGATPSANTQQAMATFVNAIVSGGLESNILTLNCIAPDSLIAAKTPLYVGTGTDPWSALNFVAGDLSINGLKGDGVNKMFNTGCLAPSTFWAPTSSQFPGFAIYVSEDGAAHNVGECGIKQNIVQMYVNFGNSAFYDCYQTVQGRITAANNPWLGFLSGQRPDIAHSSLYKASSTVPFTTLATTAANNTTSGNPNLPVSFFSIPSAVGTWIQFSPRRLSFCLFNIGYTTAQTQTLFNAVQALRVAFGGGFV